MLAGRVSVMRPTADRARAGGGNGATVGARTNHKREEDHVDGVNSVAWMQVSVRLALRTFAEFLRRAVAGFAILYEYFVLQNTRPHIGSTHALKKQS